MGRESEGREQHMRYPVAKCWGNMQRRVAEFAARMPVRLMGNANE
jgi:hypothetical protein